MDSPRRQVSFEMKGPKLLDQVRRAARVRQFSPRTEEAYVGWIRRFVRDRGLRHPAELDADDVAAFLTTLAVDGRVSAATQRQASSALLFLYREVLGRQLELPPGIVRPPSPRRLPSVLSRDEVRRVLDVMTGTKRLVAMVLYVSTTMIYTHVLNRGVRGVRSPLDTLAH